MITIYPYDQLGHANHGWLDARHHFSFASYYNPKRTGFGDLLVINDDKIAPHKGFAKHPHDNMEIITYVRAGTITHEDSMGNVGRTEAGDVQVMSAGTGVVHSEHNLENVDSRLYQIWIKPNKSNVQPRWEAKQFPKDEAQSLAVLVSGFAEHESSDALFIHADAAIYGGRLKAGAKITQAIKHQAYVLASVGEFSINGHAMKQGDGAEVMGSSELTIDTTMDSEILIIELQQH